MSGLTAARMLAAYAQGIFPMAESADKDQLYWFDPPERGILPVGGVHVSRSMQKFLRNCPWRATVDHDFPGVVAGCADRAETWINAPLVGLYDELFKAGHAHSLEIYEGDQLIGGTYGLSIGAAFFGESMFSRRPNASKCALIWMSAHLRRCGFTLWDTQYPTPHLGSMGGRTIGRPEYRRLLSRAITQPVVFQRSEQPDAQALSQETTQTS